MTTPTQAESRCSFSMPVTEMQRPSRLLASQCRVRKYQVQAATAATESTTREREMSTSSGLSISQGICTCLIVCLQGRAMVRVAALAMGAWPQPVPLSRAPDLGCPGRQHEGGQQVESRENRSGRYAAKKEPDQKVKKLRAGKKVVAAGVKVGRHDRGWSGEDLLLTSLGRSLYARNMPTRTTDPTSGNCLASCGRREALEWHWNTPLLHCTATRLVPNSFLYIGICRICPATAPAARHHRKRSKSNDAKIYGELGVDFGQRLGRHPGENELQDRDKRMRDDGAAVDNRLDHDGSSL